MKKLAIFTIEFYQWIVSPTIKNILGVQGMCRYIPTCSEYAKLSIQKYGVFQGSLLGIKRILSCQPLQSQSSNVKTQNYIVKIKTFKDLRFKI